MKPVVDKPVRLGASRPEPEHPIYTPPHLSGWEAEAPPMSPPRMTQHAPWPGALEDVVNRLDFRKDGWQFSLAHVERDDGAAAGLTLRIVVTTKDFYRDAPRHTRHEFIVPAATYNRETWARWVLECIWQIDQHESAEAFVLDGERPFAPRHGPGFNPYHFVLYDATDEQRRTAPGGEVVP